MQTLIQKSKCERTKRKKFLFPVLLIQYSKLIIIKLFHFTNDLTKKKKNFFFVNSTSNFERIAFYKIFETTHRYRYHYQIIPLYERFDKRKNFNSRERGSSFIGYFQRNIASICNRDEDLVWRKSKGTPRQGVAKFRFLRANNRWNLESIPLWSSSEMHFSHGADPKRDESRGREPQISWVAVLSSNR